MGNVLDGGRRIQLDCGSPSDRFAAGKRCAGGSSRNTEFHVC